MLLRLAEDKIDQINWAVSTGRPSVRNILEMIALGSAYAKVQHMLLCACAREKCQKSVNYDDIFILAWLVFSSQNAGRWTFSDRNSQRKVKNYNISFQNLQNFQNNWKKSKLLLKKSFDFFKCFSGRIFFAMYWKESLATIAIVYLFIYTIITFCNLIRITSLLLFPFGAK